MKKKSYILQRFLAWSCKTAGNPLTFVVALILLMLWMITGLIWGFTDTWLLVINTIATINASLMVFIIQNTQNRDMKALHIKLDGIIDALKEAENELIAIEQAEEDELEKIRQQLVKKRNSKTKD